MDQPIPPFQQPSDLLWFERVKPRRWETRWPATRLVKRGDTLPLPGRPDAIDAETARNSGCTLLLAERYAGMAVLMNQWEVWSKAAGRLALMVHGTRPLWKRASTSSQPDVQPETVWHAMQDTPAALAELLHHMLTKWGDFVLLVSFDDGGHSEEKTRAILTQLRAAWERAEGRLRLVVAAPSYNILLETNTASGLISIGDVYRLASLDEAAILEMLDARFSTEMAAESPESMMTAARRIWQATGGQPFLVDTFLERCREAREEVASIKRVADLVRRVLPLVERTPPAIVRVWQDHLHLILSRTPELVRVMEQYVEDNPQRINPPTMIPTAIETELFAAGWIGERVIETQRYWGIRSLLHRAWARPVLWRLR